jgi:transposase
MRDVELYRHLLGITAPWSVERVELSVERGRVDVWAVHGAEQKWPCPTCGTHLATFDHSEERQWRHLDSCQFQTYLHARPVRVKCPEHGVRQVEVPWAEGHGRFTSLFERLAIDVLMEASVSGAMRILRISWDEAWHIQVRAVARGRERKKREPVRHMGVDEKSLAKGQDYMTLVYDLEKACVEYVVHGRGRETLDGYFRSRTQAELEGIEAVAMDMWDAYISSVEEHVPGASEKIVFDRFHIMKHMVEAVNDVRKREHRELRAQGDQTLTGSKNLWLYSRENLPDKHRRRFAELKAQDLATGRAWAIKENLRRLWGFASLTWARKHWRSWNGWAMRSRLEPVKRVARMIRDHLQNVLTYVAHPITNAVSEGLNSKIQTIKKKAYGFRNPDNFTTAIYFHCGGLDLYPTHGNP